MQLHTTLGFLGLAALVGQPLEAHAKPKLSKTMQPLPDIEEILTEAGWTMTPEMSAKFSRPGDILDPNHTTLLNGPSCFEAEIEEGAYATMEVTRSMSAGVRMRASVVGVRAGMGLEKKIVFDTPIYRQIPRLDLIPNEACLSKLRAAQNRGEDLASWYVIIESLSAIIQQQQCGSYDAKVGAFLVSTDAQVEQACAQTSLEPVAVAYKTQSVAQLVGPATGGTSVAGTGPTGPVQQTAASVTIPRTDGLYVCTHDRAGFDNHSIFRFNTDRTWNQYEAMYSQPVHKPKFLENVNRTMDKQTGLKNWPAAKYTRKNNVIELPIANSKWHISWREESIQFAVVGDRLEIQTMKGRFRNPVKCAFRPN